MKETIWKYELEITDNQILMIPAGFQLLCVQMQREVPCLWAKVTPGAELVPVHFQIFGTGHHIPNGMGVDREYISTFQTDNGLVFHVFQYTGV